MTHNEEEESDMCVELNHNPPDEVVEHGIVLILPHTVVSMQVHTHLHQTVLLKKVVENANYGVGPLARHQLST